MQLRKSGMWLLALVVLILYLPAAGQTADKFNLKPKLSTSWKADSNYFKAETNAREVHTYLVQPGFAFGYETAKSQVLLDYTFDAYWYDEQDSVPAGQPSAEDNDFSGHTARLHTQTQPFDRLTVGLDDTYTKTRDPANADVFSNSVARDKFETNRLSPYLVYTFEGRFSLGLRYSNTKLNYSPSAVEDSEEHRGILDLSYNFSETASLGIKYQRWDRDYDLGTTGYTSDKVMLILKKQFRNVGFEAGGGYHRRDFDDVTVESFDTGSYKVAMLWRNAPENPRSTFSITADYDYNDQSAYFKTTKLTLQAGHIFLEKITLGVKASYQNSAYENTFGTTPSGNQELQDDDSYKISGDIGYPVTEWMTFSVGGGHEERDSNIAGKNYKNDYLMCALNFAYNLGSR